MHSAALSTRVRTSLVLHGILVIVLGLLAGFPYALVISGDLVGEVRAWRMAHLEGVLNGLILLGVGTAGGLILLTARQAKALLWSLLVAGYGNVVAATIGAWFGVRGLVAVGPLSNWIVFLLFTAAIIGIFLGLYLAALGAVHARRKGEG